MHPRGHELVHIRSMNWVQSTFITCHAFLFFARTSLDILGHMTVSSTTVEGYSWILPGICDVNLVSHTMGDGISPSVWSRSICKPDKPTQGAAARAECPTPAAKSAPSGAHSSQNAQVS